MRFELQSIPFWVGLLMPLYVAYNGYGVITTLFLLIMWFVLHLAVTYQSIRMRFRNNEVLLETFPLSHYVEKVRWCMDKLDIEYTEVKDIGILGIILFARGLPTLRIPGKDIQISNSSDILRYLYGCHGHSEKGQFLKPTKEALELEAKIDKMGLHIRQWIYYQFIVLSDNSHDLCLRVWGMKTPGIPVWQQYLLPPLIPIFKYFVVTRLRVNSTGAESGLKKAKAFFQESDKLLSDGRKYLLNTDEPTFVDYSFAALANVLVLSSKTGGKSLTDTYKIRQEDLVPGAQKEIKDFAKTPSGKFVRRMFEEHRID